MAFVVSAVAAAIEVTTVASVMTAVSAVGLATTVVGAVTGNKNLMKIGGEIGLVGGIGGLVNSGINALGNMAAEGAGTVADGIGAAAGDGVSHFSDAAFDAANATADAGINAANDIANGASGFGSGSGFGGDGASLGDPTGTTNFGNSAAQTATVTPSPSLTTDSLIKQPASQPFNYQTPQNAIGNAVDSATDTLVNDPNITGAVHGTDFESSLNKTPLTREVAGVSRSYGADPGFMDRLGSAWSKMSPQTQAELMKAGLAIPGGIQSQKNKEAELAIAQQRLQQTSYGSQVPKFGIISSAQKKG